MKATEKIYELRSKLQDKVDDLEDVAKLSYARYQHQLRKYQKALAKLNAVRDRIRAVENEKEAEALDFLNNKGKNELD